MIYTLTLNPALDYVIDVPDLQIGKLNRIQSEHILYGGKGINVSVMLKELGLESICLGFIAGFTGKKFQKGIRDHLQIKEKFIELKQGRTRINLKLLGKEETEINGIGPIIHTKDFKQLQQQLCGLENKDILILSGSIPSSLSSDAYAKLLASIKEKDICIVVDASGDALLQTLPYRPYLIKPNLNELEELFHQSLQSEQEIIACAKLLQKQGAKNILVSLGKDGAILLNEHHRFFTQKANKGIVKNSAGAGDSMVAGFIAGVCSGMKDEDRLALAVAAGSATAFAYGIATIKEVEKQRKQLPSC